MGPEPDEARWRLLLGHDGYFVVRLRLFTPDAGGRARALQSGYRADWILGADALPTRAPIDFVDGRRSLKPGEDALVRAYPLSPERWHCVGPGTELELWWKGGRRLGVGVVEARVNVPSESVPLRTDRDRRRGHGQSAYRRVDASKGWLHSPVGRTLAGMTGWAEKVLRKRRRP